MNGIMLAVAINIGEFCAKRQELPLAIPAETSHLLAIFEGANSVSEVHCVHFSFSFLG
jgi:hypothetical protein